MGVAYINESAAGKVDNNGFTDIRIPIPTGMSPGDLMIAQVSAFTTSPISPPGGWTTISAVDGHLVAWRKAASGEPGDYVFQITDDQAAAGIIAVYRGQHPTNPIDVTAGQSVTESSPILTPAVTATKINGMIHRVINSRNTGGATPPAPPAGVLRRGWRDLPPPSGGNNNFGWIAFGDNGQGGSRDVLGSSWSTSGGSSSFFGVPNHGVTVVIRAANEAPSAPAAFTSPASGARVVTTGIVTHGGSTDVNGDTLTYDFDLSVDNGATWSAKRVKAAGVSFTHDYSALDATNTAKWRSRAWDGTVYGPYQTSAAFKVNRAPAAPVLSAPNGGENYATSMTVSWAAATDPNSDVLSYEVEFSSDGGATWSVLATGVSLTSYTHNASTLPATQAARVRVRANDGLLPGPYDTSDANFTINRAPTAPTLLAPDNNTVANLRGGFTPTWAHNDTDLQAQKAYAFMRTRGTVTQWWDGNAWVNTEFYVASAAESVAFPTGAWPAGSYTWTVSTMDIFDAKSAYAVARNITSTGGLSMVV